MRTASCDPSWLYADGGVYDARAPEAIATAPVGTRVGEVFPPYRYARPEPVAIAGCSEDAQHSLRAFYAEHSATFPTGPRCGAFELAEAIVYDRSVYVVAPPGELVSVFESDREIDRPWKGELDASLLSGARKLNASTPAYVYFGSIGSENYGHWLVDDLARASAVLALGKAGKRCTIVLDRYFDQVDAIRVESIERFLGDDANVELVFIDKKVPYFFERLIYVTPTGRTPVLKSPNALALVRERLSAGRNERSPRRLFVGRRAQWRNLINEPEVADFFRGHGFTYVSVNFGEQTLAAQIDLFSNAEVVVGVSGASMVNSLFAPSPARMIYLAGDGFTDPWYWDLAAVLGHEYSVCFGPARDPSSPNFSSFRLEREHLETIESWL